MAETRRVALIAGVTGISGLNLAKKMLSTDKYDKWTVYGLSRRKSEFLPTEVTHVPCDLLDAAMCKERLAPLSDVTHVFYTAWINREKEVDNIAANGAMLTNLLDHLPAKLKHVVLLTGTKHYAGSFEDLFSGKISTLPTPYKESFDQHPGKNFYYELEDILSARAAEQKFSWSVARSSGVIGFAPYNQMNLGTSVAVYAAICKYANIPFAFPAIESGLDALVDIVDADLLAEHMLWEATDPVAMNQAYNVTNGDVFRFRQMWKTIADYFELHVPEKVGKSIDPKPLEPIWDEMVEKFGLKPLKLEEISTMWILDFFNATKDIFSDMTKSREHGFLVYQNSEKSFFKLFDYLRDQEIIPSKEAKGMGAQPRWKPLF